MSEGEEVRFIIYIYLFWLSPSIQASPRLGDTSPTPTPEYIDLLFLPNLSKRYINANTAQRNTSS